MATEQLTASAQARLWNINYTIAALAFAGGIGGVVYSSKTGGGFWRGVGYYIVGSVVVGASARLLALPFQNNIIKNGVVTE
jgi:hypothetical protein